MTGVVDRLDGWHVDRFGRRATEDPLPAPDRLIGDVWCRYPIRTWVVLGEGADRHAVNVGAEGMRQGEETLVDGLGFEWGRASSVDQPETSTLNCAIRQQLFPDAPERVFETNHFPDPSQEYGLRPWPNSDPTWLQVPGTWEAESRTWEQMAGWPLPGPDYLLEVDPVQAHTGRESLRLTTTAAPGTPQVSSAPLGTPAGMGLGVGGRVTASVWVLRPVGVPGLPALTLAGTAFAGPQTVSWPGTSNWVRVQVSNQVTDPDGSITLAIGGVPTVGQAAWYDDFALMPGTQTLDFNGDSPCVGRPWDACDTRAACFRWLGIPGASPSQRFRPAYHQRRLTELVHTGLRMEVWVHSEEAFAPGTRATDWQARPGPYTRDLDWFTDSPGAADYVAVGANPLGPVAMMITRQANLGGQQVDLTGWPGPARFVVPPAVFQPAGLNPNAWDHIPRLPPGTDWLVEVTCLVPPAATVQLAALGFPGPYPGSPAPLTVTADYEGLGGPVGTVPEPRWSWQTLTGYVRLPPGQSAPLWVAAGVLVPPGQLPDLTTWFGTPGSWAEQPPRWVDYLGLGIAEVVVSSELQTGRTALVWGGAVKTVGFSGLGGLRTLEARIVAADPSASMNNDYIGDEPWPHEESAETRIGRIWNLSKDRPDLDIDDRIRRVPVAFRDVDRQPVWGLWQDMANTTGAVLWPAAHALAETGSYVWFEDPDERVSAWRLFRNAETGIVTIGLGDPVGVRHLLSGQDLTLEPIEVTQDPSQVVTSVDVTWKVLVPAAEAGEQNTTEDRTENVTDADAVGRYGLQQLGIETELTSAVAAAERASRALTISRGSDKRISGLVWDTLNLEIDHQWRSGISRLERINTVLDLLDGTERLGAAAVLRDLPDWTPEDISFANYIEGGSYTLEDARWTLELNAVPAGTTGGSATWDDMLPFPLIRWVDFDPTIEWHDLFGVAAPA